MTKSDLIKVNCFGREIGLLSWDIHRSCSYFQYNPDFLENFMALFPATGILKKTQQTQVFKQLNSETFRGLPPMFADSLPDVFGNTIFQKWMEANGKNLKQISALEQLTYVANRGMGALEYEPAHVFDSSTSIDLAEIASLVEQILFEKEQLSVSKLDTESLLTIFKMGTSAGGMRPKILVSQHKTEEFLIPGDVQFSDEYTHLLVKLSLASETNYSPEVIEYCHYLTAIEAGITMMPSQLIDKQHFATERFDRQNGKKWHVLTATGLTGWDFHDPTVSSYENLFDLAFFLKIPKIEINELFKRMLFNLVFGNTDDHLKNHSFIFHCDDNTWHLAPAYDVTFSLNPLLQFKRTTRALSINGKRQDISLKDIETIAEKYTIKNASATLNQIIKLVDFWKEKAIENNVDKRIIERITSQFSVHL